MNYDTLANQFHLELTSLDRKLINEQLTELKYKPLISIITPVYNTPVKWFKKCIQSVLDQVYTNWELCLCDNGSNFYIAEIINSYSDDRIKYIRVDKNIGIAGGTNKSLSLASGEFIGFLDSDDELISSALYQVIYYLNDNPNYKFIYSDEVRVGEANDVHGINFKPDFSPDYLRSQNYVNHFSVYNKNRFDDVCEGIIREGCTGSQDYDAVLRYTENLDPKEIFHIPCILYKWIAVSSSNSVNNESYSIAGAMRSLKDHLDRIGWKAKIFADWPWYRVKYELPNPSPSVGILICSINKNNLLIQCINSILAMTDYPNYTIYLCITDDLVKLVKSIHAESCSKNKIRFVNRSASEPYNFSKFQNRMVQTCEDPIICLMNDDVVPLRDDWLSEMVPHSLHPHVGTVGSKLVYPNLTIQCAGVILGVNVVSECHGRYHPYNFFGMSGRAKLINNFIATSAACCVMRKCIFEEVGGYCEDLSTFDDVDFGIRIVNKGYYNVYNPYALLIHYESQSRGHDNTPEKQMIFRQAVEQMLKKYGPLLQNDPFYNPNLSLNNGNFELANKSRYVLPWYK